MNMPANPAVLVCDLEGTLTDKSGRKTSPELLARLRSLERAGVCIVLASGRGVEYQRALRKKWGLKDGPIVAENGCTIYLDGEETTTFPPKTFDRDSIIYDLREKGAERLAEFDPDKKHEITLYPRGFLAGKDYTAEEISDIYEFLLRTLRGVPCRIFYTSASGEVLPKSVDKGHGLRVLFEKAKLSAEKTVFIGDGQNDIPAADFILEGKGRVGAPANAVEELKAVSTFVATKEYFEGAIEAIDFFFPKKG
jgi:HAD superfamily hydrolase (TIGR01484 family)